MSVILDALHKARGDRKKNTVENHPNSVAKVLEPVISDSDHPERSLQPARTGWVLPVIVVLSGIGFLAAVGGGFFLLYDQMRRLEPAAATAAPIVPPTMSAATAPTSSLETELSVPAAAALPPPLPLTELPVQPPGVAAAAPAVTGQANGAQPVATSEPQFKLGSVVCENNECLALLNGRTVREGDKIKGYMITEITATGMTLRSLSGSEEIILDLYD